MGGLAAPVGRRVGGPFAVRMSKPRLEALNTLAMQPAMTSWLSGALGCRAGTLAFGEELP